MRGKLSGQSRFLQQKAAGHLRNAVARSLSWRHSFTRVALLLIARLLGPLTGVAARKLVTAGCHQKRAFC